MSFFNFKNLFSILCTFLTLGLVYQELYTFSVERPTTVSTEEGTLNEDDFPEVVICTEPGLDLRAVKKHGYLMDTFYRGSSDGQKFVGWNGVKGEKSSEDILDEVLTINDTSLIRFDRGRGISEDLSLFVAPNITLRKLMYPHGRCLSVRPSDTAQFGYGAPMTVYFELNNTAIDQLVPDDKNVLMLRIYFMDNANSPKIFPDSMERMNQLDIKLNSKHQEVRSWFNYETSIKIKIGRSHHVKEDPLFECTEYSKEETYHDCIHEEILDIFEREIGCAPPFLTKSPSSMCNKRFDLADDKDERLKKIFRTLLLHVMDFKCKTPCTQRTYKSTITHQVPYNGTSLILTFSPKVAVTKSKFSIDGQTLLTRFGGSVSSGRTLLWILLGFVGASQVGGCWIVICFYSCFYVIGSCF